MSELFSGLTPEEIERLAILMEEMAEAQQVIGKILRHGYPSKHPKDLGGPDNRGLLEHELGHVLYAIDMAVHAGDLKQYRIEDHRARKSATVWPYLHHQTRIP